MKNTKLTLATVFMSVILATTVMAFDISPLDVIAPNQPEAPGTGDNACIQYSTRDARCNQYMLIFEECFPTMTGNYWYQQQVDCRAMGTDYTCVSNECKYVAGSGSGGTGANWQALLQQYWWLILIIGVIILWKEKKIKF